MDLELYASVPVRARKAWSALLARTSLTPESTDLQTVLLWDEDRLVATGSRQDNVLKYIAVDPAYQGEGLTAKVLTALRQAAFEAGHKHLFLYTKPANKLLFSSLFFYPVAQTADALLMEDQKNGIANFLAALPAVHTGENIGAIVMNCDPFTLGHQYLVQFAARQCSHLYVFVLSEDKGHFSSADRLEMAKRGAAHLPNVTVLPSGPYLISAATFPAYFLKERASAGQVHCALDIAIFTQYFSPRFSISRRFVGTEPLCAVTNSYNKALKESLPQHGITVTEVPRMEQNGIPVSASAVRKAIANKDWDLVQKLVPETTYQYLTTRR